MTARTARENDTMPGGGCSRRSPRPTGAPTARGRRAVLAVSVAAAALALSACSETGDLAAYDLPSKAARYTFEAETNGVSTRWEYVSARPAKGDAPELNPCMGDMVGDNKAVCRPEPLIFLRYDLNLALDNTAEADGTHPIEVVAYYQDRLTSPPRVTSLKVETSYDGGKSWHRATSRNAGTNTFTATIHHPGRKQAAQGVGLRITASDSKGDTVEQTLPTAYKLR
ncbi:hypothetical protein [Streptomyces sp. NPDC047070]|uniref:hypothetical protein n=1 Tax=Streptomyces sp. NPDC047070 TaxID=3154923 RepID=UPI003452112B